MRNNGIRSENIAVHKQALLHIGLYSDKFRGIHNGAAAHSQNKVYRILMYLLDTLLTVAQTGIRLYISQLIIRDAAGIQGRPNILQNLGQIASAVVHDQAAVTIFLYFFSHGFVSVFSENYVCFL